MIELVVAVDPAELRAARDRVQRLHEKHIHVVGERLPEIAEHLRFLDRLLLIAASGNFAAPGPVAGAHSVTVTTAAALIGTSERTLRDRAQNGRIPGAVYEPAGWRIPLAYIEQETTACKH